MGGIVFQFAKAPEPGRVKTRMQPQLTPEQSAQLHQDLFSHCHRQLQQWCRQRLDVSVALAVTPADHPYWRRDFGAARLWPQPGGHLGNRMRAALAAGLAEPAVDWVILVGSDCPALTPEYLELAHAALQRGAQLVLGPATDGGYVLIGMRGLVDVFESIDWGTERVLAQTFGRAAELAVHPELLPALSDIDRPADLAELSTWPELAHWTFFVPN